MPPSSSKGPRSASLQVRSAVGEPQQGGRGPRRHRPGHLERRSDDLPGTGEKLIKNYLLILLIIYSHITLFIVYKGSWILQTRAIPYYLEDFYRFYPLFFQ